MNQLYRSDVLRVLEQVRPYVQGDGGDIELVDITDQGEVVLNLTGECVGCSSIDNTVDDVIQGIMKSQLSWVTSVTHQDENATDGSASEQDASATGRLEVLQAAAQSLLENLQQAVANSMPTDELSSQIGEWAEHARSDIRHLFDLEERCLFPVIEMFLTDVAQQLPAFRESHERIVELLVRFEGCVLSYNENPDKDKLDMLKVVAGEMADAINTNILKKQCALYELVNSTLSDDLKQEVRSDISRFRRNNLAMYSG